MILETSVDRPIFARVMLNRKIFPAPKLLGQGKGVREIAEALLLNNRTVSTYKARLIRGVNFKNRFTTGYRYP